MRQLHAFVAAGDVCRDGPNSLSHVPARYGGAGLAGFPGGTYIRAAHINDFLWSHARWTNGSRQTSEIIEKRWIERGRRLKTCSSRRDRLLLPRRPDPCQMTARPRTSSRG